MTALTEVVVALQRWDDDAWIAISSRGLLRRADKLVADRPPSVRDDTATSVEVDVADQTVRFDTQGPAAATCTCPAPGTCQHVIAAGRWLAAARDVASSSGPDPVDELLAITDADLVAYAGRDELRRARGVLAGLDPEREVTVTVEEREVRIALARPTVRFRFLGGGVTGLVADVRSPHLARLRCAAVLAFHRWAGREVELPPATSGTAVDTDHRVQVLQSVTDLLLDTVRVGLAHPSAGTEERFRSLAVGARTAGLPRLERGLLRLADQVEHALARSVTADTDVLLSDAAQTFALAAALAADPTSVRLAGRPRESYDATRTLRLVGLGGLPWRAASGYAGLTCLFWSPAEQRFLSWTDARPQDGGLDPRQRWTAPGPWPGVPSPARTSGALVRLVDARVSASGRVSGVDRTTATLAPLASADIDGLPATSRWSEVGRPPRSLLDPPAPLRDWVVLRPRLLHPPVFDDRRQVAMRLAEDDDGSLLPLEVRWTREQNHAVGRLEELDLVEGAMVVARLGAGAGGRVALPLSVVGPGAHVDALHFDGTGPSGPPPRDGGPDDGLRGLPALAGLRAWLRDAAERGTGADRGELVAELARRHVAARAQGFTLLPATPSGEPAEQLLRSAYLVLQVEAVARDRG